jgi:hypothetical protein
MKSHAAGSGGLLRRTESPGGRVRVVGARGASDRAQVQERFLRELAAVELWFRGQGIPHAIVGSLACWAHAGHGAAPVFGRPEAFGAVQRWPDSDTGPARGWMPSDSMRALPGAARSRWPSTHRARRVSSTCGRASSHT